MVHTRMSAIGWVVGGAETVVTALLDVLGPAGTLMAYVGWNDSTGGLTGWPPVWQEAYRSECPPFDPEFSETDRQMGRVPERIRTWPGARVSSSHFRRMAAIGAAAGWLTEDQPWNHGFGPGSPLAKLVEADGQVLLLGAPLGPADDPSPCRVPGGQPGEADGKSCDSRCGRATRSSGGRPPTTTRPRRLAPSLMGGWSATRIRLRSSARSRSTRDAVLAVWSVKLKVHPFPAKPLVRFGVEWMNNEFGA